MLPPPGTNRIATDSVIVALSVKDVSKDKPKLSEMLGVSAKGSTGPIAKLGESERLKVSAKAEFSPTKLKERLSDIVIVSVIAGLVIENTGTSVTLNTLLLFKPDSVAKLSSALAKSSKA
jgi:hypothetical protein